MVSYAIEFLAILSLLGCSSSPTFEYKYYTLSSGKLLGAQATDDIPVSVCDNYGCLVMKTGDFLKMKEDYLDTKQKLINCERK